MLGDQILHFLEFVYYLLSHFENCWSSGPEIFTVFTVHLDLQILNKSKKIVKNVKFGLQAHINMENKMNGLDRSFGFWIDDLWSNAQTPPCIAMHHSPSLSLYIYIYVLYSSKLFFYNYCIKLFIWQLLLDKIVFLIKLPSFLYIFILV